jgi:hypothetical protein
MGNLFTTYIIVWFSIENDRGMLKFSLPTHRGGLNIILCPFKMRLASEVSPQMAPVALKFII